MINVWMPTNSLVPASSILYKGIATQNSEVHVAYLDGSVVKYMKSTNEGESFSAAITISSGAAVEELPLTQCIAVDGNYVHVVYARDRNNASLPCKLYYVRSTDGGSNWSAETTLVDGTGDNNNTFVRVSLVAENGYVHLVWSMVDSSNFTGDPLYYRRSTDNGGTWATRFNIDSIPEASRPELTAIDGSLHVVWMDFRNGINVASGEIGYTRSTNRGTSWEVSRVLTSSSNTTLRPTVSGYSNYVVVGWQEPVTAEEIKWRTSSDYGVSFNAAQTLVEAGIQEHPVIVNRDGVFAMCYINDNLTPHTTQVRFSYDNAASWGSAQTPYTPASDIGAPLIDFTRNILYLLDSNNGVNGFVLVGTPVLADDPQETLLDNFNRASLGSNWTTPGILTFTDGLVITGSTAICRGPTGGYRQGGYYNVRTFSSTEMVADLSAWTTSGSDPGLALYGRLRQIAAGTTDGYGADVKWLSASSETLWEVWRTDNTSTTILSDGTLNIAAGGKIAFTCRNNLLIAWYKASGATEWTQVAAALDSTYTTGNIGLEFLADQTTQVTNLYASETTDIVVSSVGGQVPGSRHGSGMGYW